MATASQLQRASSYALRPALPCVATESNCVPPVSRFDGEPCERSRQWTSGTTTGGVNHGSATRPLRRATLCRRLPVMPSRWRGSDRHANGVYGRCTRAQHAASGGEACDAAVTVWLSARTEPTSQLSNNRAASDMTRSRPIASQDCERNVNCGLAAVTRLRMADANASCSRRRPPERKPPATAKK